MTASTSVVGYLGAHRDFKTSAVCPGDGLYSKLDDIRRRVQLGAPRKLRRVGRAVDPFAPQAVAGSPLADTHRSGRSVRTAPMERPTQLSLACPQALWSAWL
jgi:hypothetical protein